jgi:hypothetical protein
MTIKLSIAVKNAKLDAVETAIDAEARLLAVSAEVRRAGIEAENADTRSTRRTGA